MRQTCKHHLNGPCGLKTMLTHTVSRKRMEESS